MTSLRILKIGENDISRLDLGLFPKLRTLDADNNRLSNLFRSGGCPTKLDSLSIRSQRVKEINLPTAEMGRVKRLYISGEPSLNKVTPVAKMHQVIVWPPLSSPGVGCPNCSILRPLLATSLRYRTAGH